MPTILHLSDLHLGKNQAWERKTDDKAGIVPADENSRLSVIETSLRGVKAQLHEMGECLDAVVVSGDITTANDDDGFRRFVDVVNKLELVASDRVVVVPGNHDVNWSAAPGTAEKYELFLKHTRDNGMRTPFCDGVDGSSADGPCDARPILDLGDALVVSVNTANWCGTELELDQGVVHTFDIARVSELQLERLTDELRAYESHVGVRIAVLHHQLLPVSEDEETKPFEAFTNLARLRSWLRLHGFHVVLHGHKHHDAVVTDSVQDLTGDGVSRSILIASAPTPSTWGRPLGRILRVGESSGRKLVRFAPSVSMATLVAQRHERSDIPESVSFVLDSGQEERAGLVAIEAETADAAYEQLLERLDRGAGTLHNVVCVVHEAESAEILPTNYQASPDDPKAWLSDAVSWWQDPAPALVAGRAAQFNHGERLYGAGTRRGPLDAAAAQLGSTKALAILVTNEELRSEASAPAFVAVQLVKVRQGANARLDCVGYFRKQDLTLWWPVNVAELRAIQKRVLDLAPNDQLESGRLITIAVEGVKDSVLPELSGTIIDRTVDLRPEVLMTMAYRVSHGPLEPSERDEVLGLWTRMLKDIGSGGNYPSLGIQQLIDHLKVFRDVGQRTQVETLIKRLEAVYDRAHRAAAVGRTRSDRQKFSKELFDLAGEVLEAVEQALGESQSQESPA